MLAVGDEMLPNWCQVVLQANVAKSSPMESAAEGRAINDKLIGFWLMGECCLGYQEKSLLYSNHPKGTVFHLVDMLGVSVKNLIQKTALWRLDPRLDDQ